MAEHQDPRSPTPQAYRFGVAAELDRGAATRPRSRGPAPTSSVGPRSHPLDHRFWQCRSRAHTAPLRGRTWAHLFAWWASRDGHNASAWQRHRCRRGHHDIRGGQQMQLGSRLVNVERCCVWCGAKPAVAPFQTMTAPAPAPAWPETIR